ncbi:MAG: hypothetical protein JWR82_2177 [Blastococcus sp.]|nr:hypothetical protein [Blastococcus sp.]
MVLAGAVIVAGTSNAPASAGPAPELCTYDAARGPVPADFAVEACVDGTSVVLRNDLDFPLVVEAAGTGAPVDVRRADGPAPTLVRLVVDADVILLPGDVVRWPLTDGPARLVLSTAEPRVASAMAESLRPVLPDTSSGAAGAQVYHAAASLVQELAPTVEQRSDCVEAKNWLQVAACDVSTASTVSGAVTEQLEQAEANAVLPVALDRELWSRWAESRAPDLGDAAGGLSVVLTQQARPGWVGDLPPWADASVVALQLLGLPVHPALAAAAQVAVTTTTAQRVGTFAPVVGGVSAPGPQQPTAAGPGQSSPGAPPAGAGPGPGAGNGPGPGTGPGPGNAPAPKPAPAPNPAAAPRPAPQPAQPAQPQPAQEKPDKPDKDDDRNDDRDSDWNNGNDRNGKNNGNDKNDKNNKDRDDD